MGKKKKRDRTSKDDEALERKRTAKDAKKAAKSAKRAAKDAERGNGPKKGKGEKKGKSAAPAHARGGPEQPVDAGAGEATDADHTVDQVTVLKLALRDTEAKLVAAEHRLHQVQQQLEDERRALADATGTAAEEAVVDAAVAETVAEAVVAAVTEQDGHAPGRPTDAAAATLEEAAEAIDAALASADHAAGGGQSAPLTPPLPHEGGDDRPNASWTLVRLRKEAERRGITGVSNLPKAALVARLNA